MEQARSRMAVEGGLQPQRPHQRLQPGDVSGQIPRLHRGILDAGRRFGVALAAGQQRKPRLAQRPNRLRFRLALENGLAQAQAALGQCRQAVVHVIKKLDRQDGLAGFELQFEQVARGLELALALGLVEQDPVEVFDGGGLQIEQFHRRLHRLGHRGEEDQAQALLLRQRNDLHFRRHDGRQGPFAAAQEMVEVVRLPHATVNRVSQPAFRQDRRQALGNPQPVEIDKVADQLALLAQRVVPGPDRHDPAIGQNHFQLVNVIRRRAIHRRVRAARIVGDHPAERRPRARRHVRPKAKAVGPQEVVQVIQHHSRSHAHRAPLHIQVCDLALVAREIHDQPVPEGPARQPRAGTARGDGHPRLRRGLDQRTDLAGVGGKRNRLRRDLVKRGVRCVELAREIIEGNFTVRPFQRRLLLGRNHRAAATYLLAA